tara:strand:+ start:145 stop:963 length:819 start_codon:yes stop_codon:yes gene_type:complete
MKKDVVAGLGEIGLPMQKLLSRIIPVVGYDKKIELINAKKLKKFENYKTEILHICIPFTKNFISNILVLEKKFKPEIIVVHSTIRPTTTQKLQSKLSQPIIYSPLRGVHKRKNDKLQEHKKGISFDIKRYVKFYSIQPNVPKGNIAAQKFSKRLRKCGLKIKKISTPVTLELAKILCDTSYYGWLINYAQLSKMIAVQYNVDYDEMWSFSEEIHKLLGNRPKMYPGIIGGHCVIPNLDLIENQSLHFIKKLNKKYSNKIKHSKTISKKYKAK